MDFKPGDTFKVVKNFDIGHTELYVHNRKTNDNECFVLTDHNSEYGSEEDTWWFELYGSEKDAIARENCRNRPRGAVGTIGDLPQSECHISEIHLRNGLARGEIEIIQTGVSKCIYCNGLIEYEKLSEKYKAVCTECFRVQDDS